MLSIALLNQAGETLKTVELNEEVFGIEPNQQVIYDVVNAQRAAMRQGTHDTLNRTEVRGGGKKPWNPLPLEVPVTSTTSPAVKISHLIS